MLNFRTAFLTIFVAAFLSIAGYAQTPPAKSVFINTAAFYDEKAGITKLIKAEKEMDAEFALEIKALQDNNAKLQKIADDIDGLRKQPSTAANDAAIAAKQEQGSSLQRKVEYDKTDLEAKINKSREAKIAPITFDIGKAISEFAKKNGYSAVFDASKMMENGSLIEVSDTADITKEFIAFYNARAANVPVAK